jgi:hypothetical protein
MGMKPLLFLCLAALSFTGGLHAQVEYVHLFAPLRNPLSVAYTPFGSVLVLDNRPDTTRLYTIQSGQYPPLEVDLDTPVRVAVQQYLEAAMSFVSKRNDRLLVRIEYLGVPNTRSRNFLLFVATAYVQKGDDAYLRLLRVKKMYPNFNIGPSRTIDAVCRDLFEAAGVAYGRLGGPPVTHNPRVERLMRDTAAFVCAAPGPLLSLQQIDRNKRVNWGEAPILRADQLTAGTYKTFKRLRENQVTPRPVKMRFDPKDSLFVWEGAPKKAEYHELAVCDGQDLFIRLKGDKYVPVDREETGLYFYVPRGVPDMYALLTRGEDLNYQPSGTLRYTGGGFSGPIYIPVGHPKGGGGGGGGNDVNPAAVLIVLAGVIIVGVTVAILVHEARKRAAIRGGINGDYRYCTVDMDTGDILYDRDDYPLQGSR